MPLYLFVYASDLSENRFALFGPMHEVEFPKVACPVWGKLCENKWIQAGVRWMTKEFLLWTAFLLGFSFEHRSRFREGMIF